MDKSKVYIIIVNYRKWIDTLECIESVLASSYENFSIIVVDNNSGNQSLQQLENTFRHRIECRIEKAIDLDKGNGFPKLLLLQNEKNTGFAAGNNVVLNKLKNEDAFLWMLNPDMTIESSALENLIKFAVADKKKKITGAVIRSYHEKQKILFYGGGKVNFNSGTVKMIKKTKDIPELDYISGECLFVHASVFNELGTFPEEYFLYWEETAWCYKAKQQGVKLEVCLAAVCYDKISTVIGKGFMADYYYTRNGLYFVTNQDKNKIRPALTLARLRFLKRLLTGQWERARGVKRGIADYLKDKRYEME